MVCTLHDYTHNIIPRGTYCSVSPPAPRGGMISEVLVRFQKEGKGKEKRIKRGEKEKRERKQNHKEKSEMENQRKMGKI